MAILLIVLVAAAGGFAVALQAQLASSIETRLGTLEAVFLTYGVGGLLAALLMLAARGGNLSAWREVPAYAYGAGVFGLVIVGAISWTVSRLGVVRGLLLITAAQFLLSAAIDQFGWFGAEVRTFDLPRAAGVALLLIGSWLVLR
ncbi:MAG TPA: DMT family transporter [Euzebyales bacterium]|nr:DMT family transporter [Euzebyales bacterium]